MGNRFSGSRRGQQHVIDNRRRLVSGLLLRHRLSPAQIHRALADDPATFDPATRSPWAYSTITADVRQLRAQWRAEAADAVLEAHARALAELQEVKSAGWQKGALGVVLSAIQSEIKLLGLDAHTPESAPPWQSYATRQDFEDAALDRFRAIHDRPTPERSEPN